MKHSTDRVRPGARCAALAWVLGCLLTACISNVHSPESLTRIGFRSPRQTFETYQAALDFGLLPLEYRCLSQDFIRRNRLSDLVYREFRDELARREPFLRLAARAKIVREWDDGKNPKVHWIEAKVDVWGASATTARLRLVREDFFEIYAGAARALDGFLDSGDLAIQFSSDPKPSIAARAALREPPDETFDSSKASELRMGHEWKIDDIVQTPSEGP